MEHPVRMLNVLVTLLLLSHVRVNCFKISHLREEMGLRYDHFALWFDYFGLLKECFHALLLFVCLLDHLLDCNYSFYILGL